MIVVGNMQFKDNEELKDTTRNKLKLIGCKTIDVKHNEFQYFLDLLKLHPEAESKIGCGVSSFIIMRNPLNRKGLSMELVRQDGSRIDFSWINCCTRKTKPRIEYIKQAMRHALVKTKPLIKTKCEMCQTTKGPFDAHHAIMSFDMIADLFIKKHPAILNSELTDGIGTYFHDASKDVEQLWLDYHDNLVTWQILCKSCHKKEDKKLKVKEQTMNNITITISAPELVEAMNRLADALQAGQVKPAQVEQVVEKLQEEAKPRKPKADKPAPAPEPEPVTEVTATDVTATNITLDDIRIKLGNLSQAGKQAEVKKLIASYGATKLSEINTEKYADLMAEAEALHG